MRVESQAWSDILARYQVLAADSEIREPMLEFVAHLTESEYSEFLHPWTSMFQLRLTQTDNHPFQEGVPYLQISPLNNGSAEFRYVDSYIESKHWVRIADKGRFMERFESFVDQIGWKSKIL